MAAHRGRIAALFASALTACHNEPARHLPPAPTPPATAASTAPRPAPPPPAFAVSSSTTHAVTPGVEVTEAVLDRDGAPMTVWLYRPVKPATAHPPLIVIGAAGSPMLWGMPLAESDREEHVPWAERGYVVAAYSIDGAVADQEADAQVIDGVRRFVRAHAGLDNARAALDFAVAQVPALDARRIFAVGHSSASVIALRFGAEDPRVAATVAFAPPVDVEGRLADALDYVERVAPGGRAVIHASSPLTFSAALRAKPVFLFYAEDDSVITTTDVPALFAAMQPAHAASKLVAVPSGDHYDSMIEEGIPAAAAWLAQR